MRVLGRISPDISWRSAIVVLLIAALLVPVIVASGFFFPYVVPRNIFFRVVIELATAVLIWSLCVGSRELDLRYEPILWALIVFLAAASVSAFVSPARTHSFFGDFERMGGVWAWLHLALFFLVLRALREEDWKWILNAALVVSMFVSATEIREHFQLVSSSHFVDSMVSASSSTIGNSGLLAPYLLFAVALAGYLASASVSYRLLYIAAGGVNLLALIYAENRSTLIGLALGAIVGGTVFGVFSAKSRRRWIPSAVALAFASLIVLISVGIRAFPSSALTRYVPTVLQRLALTNPAGSDESRTMQWRAAVEGFEDRPLLGFGVENHNLAWSAHFDPGIYHIDTDIYDRTHNQFLEMLATTGLIGTTAFLAIWVAIGVTLYRAYRDQMLSMSALAVLIGLQVAYATYLVFWFVDLNSTMLWILCAALIASRANPNGVVRVVGEQRERRRTLPLGIALASAVLLTMALYSEAYVPLRANRALARIDSPRGSVREALADFRVLSTSPAHQTAHTATLMSQYLGSLRPRFEEMRSDPTEKRMIEGAFAQTISAFNQEIHRDSLNDRLYAHEASLLMEAGIFFDSRSYLDQAVDVLHTAIDLSPRRIQQRLLLASLYNEEHDYERAQVALGDAVRIDPDLGEPRYRLAEAYLKTSQGDSALAMLQSSLKLGYVGSPEIYLAIGKRLEFSARTAEAARLYSNYLEAKYTRAVWNGPGTIAKPVPTSDIAVAAHLPLLYVRAEESELAIKTAAALAAFDSSRSAIVERFVSDVGSRRRRGWVAKNSLLPCESIRASRSGDSIALGACGVFRRKL